MNKLIGLLSIAVIVVVGWFMYHLMHKPAPVDNTPAIVAPAILAVAKEEVKLVKIQAYKQEAKAVLPLPQKIKDDQAEHVVAATQTPDDDHKHTVTTVVNVDTGETTTIDHKEPLPWLAVEKSNELRVDYGYKGDPNPLPVARLSFRADLVQVKALHFGLNTSLDFDGEYFVGVGVGWKF
jgi:hypothetical protein